MKKIVAREARVIDSPMKWFLLVGVFAAFCASTRVSAEVGQKPFPKIEGGSGNDPPPVIFSIPPAAPAALVAAQVCNAEIDQAVRADQDRINNNARDSLSRSKLEVLRSGQFGRPCGADLQRSIEDAEAQIALYASNIEKARTLYRDNPGLLRYSNNENAAQLAGTKVVLCALRAKVAACGASTSVTVQPASSGVNRTSPTSPVPPNASDNSAADTQQLTKQWRDAFALAQQRQADIDRARVGKPRLHKGGSVAHHCLKPQPGGGMLNDCPYAVEYHYCVYRPKKDSWSEAFECGRNGGAWQVGAGPGTPVLMHMGGEITYWFACRYGDTLQKPDGISPADIEFQVGRGLLGRCAEWGSKRG